MFCAVDAIREGLLGALVGPASGRIEPEPEDRSVSANLDHISRVEDRLFDALAVDPDWTLALGTQPVTEAPSDHRGVMEGDAGLVGYVNLDVWGSADTKPRAS